MSTFDTGKVRELVGLTLALLLVLIDGLGPVKGDPRVGDESARAVMALFDEVEDGDAASAELKMLLIDQSGNRKQRQFGWKRLDSGADSRSTIVFSAPADLSGTGFVGWNWAGERADDTWLCLPALQRCKRVANAGQSGAFLGTDFSFYDINGFNLDDWDYQFVEADSSLDGEPVWLIEATPRAGRAREVEDKTGYRRFHAWVSKRSHLMVKARYWLTRPHREKYFFASDVRQVDGIWTIFQQQMLSLERGEQVHATVIQLGSIDYGVTLNESEMTTAGLMQGW